MPSPAHGSREGRRIIVTDDTPISSSPLPTPSARPGHCVFAAYNGAAALELVTQLPFIDLLVTNTRLGIIDGRS
jgi:CheY-like chemotaxis protein